MLHFAVLGSGSSGNSAVVCLGDETRILIDAGLSARQLRLRLEALEVDPDSIDAVILTHEHSDHCGGLDVFCRKRETPLPVYATSHTCEMVGESITRSRSTIRFMKFEAGQDFGIGGITVESFSVPHDAVDPVGFVLRGRQSSVGVLSDVGHVTALIRDRLQGVDTLFVEANYDDVMLQNDVRRPWSTKQRISSRHGHLSNEQTAELVISVAGPNLNRVILGHLSADCNAPDVASQAISRRLFQAGFQGVQVECAERRSPLPLLAAANGDSLSEVRYPSADDPDAASAGRVRDERPAAASHHSRPRKEFAAAAANSVSERNDWVQGEWSF